MNVNEFGADETLPRGEERPREASEHAADGKRGELRNDRVDAYRAAGDFILAQGFPRPPDGQAAQAQRHKVGEEREGEDDVIKEDDAIDGTEVQAEKPMKAGVPGLVERETEEGRLRDAVDAVRTARQALPVQENDADDLAEGQRHDGEVVASQAKHGKGERNAKKRRKHARQREAHPERPAELSRDQRIGVGPDRVKGHITEIEQSRQPHDHVQAPAQHDVNEDLGCGVDCVALCGARYEEGEGDCYDEERDRKFTSDIRGETRGEPGFPHSSPEP